MQTGYRAEVEMRMKRLYVRLSEKDRRRYAAVEADKLGHGGFEYIAKLFEIDPKTIRQGLKDLEEEQDPAGERIRKKGASIQVNGASGVERGISGRGAGAYGG
jgi:hypothetical protein